MATEEYMNENTEESNSPAVDKKTQTFAWYLRGDASHLLRDWFERLHGTPLHNEGEVRPPNKAARSELRRARTPIEAAITPFCGELLRDLRQAGHIGKNDESNHWFTENLERIGIIAAVSSHLYAEAIRGTVKFGQQMSKAQSGDADKPIISQARFRRLLLSYEDSEELMSAMIRIVRQIDSHSKSLNIVEIANIIWRFRSPKTRQRLAYDYYAFLPESKS